MDTIMYTNLIEIDYNPFEKGRDIEKVIALNESQKELWLSCVIGGDSANLAYNESVSLNLRGHFDINAFNKAIQSLITRHESLRANVSQSGESLIIYKNIKFNLIYNDFSHIESVQQTNQLNAFILKEISIPFNLYNDVLFKIYIHKLDDETHHLTIIIHHIIGDGWSIGIILEDLGTLYSSYLTFKEPKLAKAEQISEYAIQQAAFRLSAEYKDTLDFWLDKYKDTVPILDLPLDYARPSTRTYAGNRNDYPVEKSLIEEISILSKKANSSIVATLIAAFEVFLYNETGSEDIVVGLPAAGQLATENLNLVGHCVNLLPLRSKILPNSSFFDYLKKRKIEIYNAYDYQKLTFSELLKQLNIKRNKANIPLVPVVFNVDKGMDNSVKFAGLVHKISSNPRVSQTFEISLNVNGSKNDMIFEWAYNSNLFTSTTIDRMMEDFTSLLKNVTSNPDVLIKDAAQTKNPFPNITPNYCNYPKNRTIIDLFEKQVKLNGDKKAIIFEGKYLTYIQLNKKVNQLANYLIGKGITKNSLVPICIKPSLEMIVAILGILKSGAAYIPIDPEYPSFRIKFLADESKSNIIISDASNYTKLKDALSLDIVILDNPKSEIWKAKDSAPNIKIEQDNLIYIIYTSGSTGNPKGVMIEHGSLVDYIFGLKSKVMAINDCKSFALGSAISTDLGNTTLFSSLIIGAELHLFEKDRFNNVDYIHNYFKEEKIDFLKIVPSHWKYLTKNGEDLFPIKLLMFGGETLPGTFIKKIKDSNTSCSIVNHYGPTETTIGKLIHIVDKNYHYPTTVPIGKPFSNTSLFVLNKNLKFCLIGVPGELYIGGAGIARGYLNNPQTTAASFIQNPLSKEKDTIYKTGDLVRWLNDGNIQYLGRIDDQVKIRGNRIELGEIQNVLQKYNSIKQSAVLVEDTIGDEKQLIAYLVTDNEFDKDNIINFLRDRLPEYMIPRIMIRIAEIPLTSNGKIDRKALPKRDILDIVDENLFVAPNNSDQKLIAKIWADALALKQVSIKDDFFELGGHSMIAIKVMIEIEKQTGIRLPLASLFDNPTVEKIALLLHPTESKKYDSLVAIKTTGNKSPIYLVHGGGLNVLVFKSMSKYLDDEQPVYALQALGLNGETNLYYKIEDIATKYLSEILTQNPEGPYFLAGYSLGGKIVYEIAKQLLQMGKEVKMLAIFDTYNPIQADGINKINQKLLRQVKKIPFMFKRLVNEPKETIAYQLHIVKNKFVKTVPVEEVFVSDPEILRSYETAYNAYKIEPLDLKIDLFRVKKRIYFIDDPIYLGWKNFAVKGIKIHEVPGDHKTFLYSPNDKEFAEVLQNTLNENQ